MNESPERGDRHGPAVRSPLRRFAIRFIQTYRTDVSPHLGASCAFTPSCSEYGLLAFRQHAFPVAMVMTLWRLARCRRPTRAAVLVRGLAALALVALAGLGLSIAPSATAAPAQGQCPATIAGVNAASAATPEKAIEVQHDATVAVAGGMTSGPVAYDVQLEFAGLRWTATSGTGSGATWSGRVDVATYAKYGVGIYKVHATSSNPAGQTCATDSYVKVVGKNPLTTPAGIGGSVAIVGGLALTAAATIRAAKPVVAEYDTSPRYDPAHERQVTRDILTEVRTVDPNPIGPMASDPPEMKDAWMNRPRCTMLSLYAFFLTAHAMLENRKR